MPEEFAHPVERTLRKRRGAHVGILFRRDFDRLAPRWGLTELAAARPVGSCVSSAVGTGTGRRDMTESARMLDTREDFRVDVAQEGEVSVVSVGGDVDLHSAPVLRVRLAALADAHVGHVVLDLSDATFLDSMALGVILAAKKRQTASAGPARPGGGDAARFAGSSRSRCSTRSSTSTKPAHEAIGSADGLAG